MGRRWGSCSGCPGASFGLGEGGKKLGQGPLSERLSPSHFLCCAVLCLKQCYDKKRRYRPRLHRFPLENWQGDPQGEERRGPGKNGGAGHIGTLGRVIEKGEKMLGARHRERVGKIRGRDVGRVLRKAPERVTRNPGNGRQPGRQPSHGRAARPRHRRRAHENSRQSPPASHRKRAPPESQETCPPDLQETRAPKPPHTKGNSFNHGRDLESYLTRASTV